MIRLASLLLCLLPVSVYSAELTTLSVNGKISVNSWKALRDFRVVKQELDYSCGAASLATILNEFYGYSLSEEDVLLQMEQDGAASFEDLAEVAHLYGFKSGGINLTFGDLLNLQVPAIAYLNYRGQDHFTVIRSVSPSGDVLVGDPSWGNKRFRGSQFRKLWETVQSEDGSVKGRLLLIVPEDVETSFIDRTFFGGDIDLRNLVRFLKIGRKL